MKAKKEKKKNKKEKEKDEEDGEAHPLVNLTKIDPDEIPDVPK